VHGAAAAAAGSGHPGPLPVISELWQRLGAVVQVAADAMGCTASSVAVVPPVSAEEAGSSVAPAAPAAPAAAGPAAADSTTAVAEQPVAAPISSNRPVEPLRLGGTEDRQKLHDELVKDLQASMGLNSLIFTMTQKAPKLVGAELCTVYLCDYAKQELWSVATGSGEEFRIPINEGLAGTVATNMEVINIPDCYADPRWKGHEFDQATGFTTRNMLVFPIAQFENSTRVGESSKPVGVLQMINKVGDAGFDKADEDMLRNFVGPAALVIAENPMYYKHEQKGGSEAEIALAGGGSSPGDADALLPTRSFKKTRSRRPSVEAVVEEEGDEEEEVGVSSV